MVGATCAELGFDANVQALIKGLLGVDPRLVLSGQMLGNRQYQRHEGALPDLEKRVRLMSAEYRELQRARPIEVISAAAE